MSNQQVNCLYWVKETQKDRFCKNNQVSPSPNLNRLNQPRKSLKIKQQKMHIKKNSRNSSNIKRGITSLTYWQSCYYLLSSRSSPSWLKVVLSHLPLAQNGMSLVCHYSPPSTYQQSSESTSSLAIKCATTKELVLCMNIPLTR